MWHTLWEVIKPWLEAFVIWLPLYATYLYMSHRFHPRRKHEHHEHHKHHPAPAEPIHHVFLLSGDCDMGQTIIVPFAPTTDQNTAKRVFSFLDGAVTVNVESDGPAGGNVTSPVLTATYTAGAALAATVTPYNQFGVAGAPTPCTPTLQDAVTPAAADPITQVGLVTA